MASGHKDLDIGLVKSIEPLSITREYFLNYRIARDLHISYNNM